LVTTVLGASVLLWNRTFISLWIGPEHFVGALANLLIVVVTLQFVLIRTDANVIDLTLRLNKKVILGALSVALSLMIASALVYFFHMGIVGVCIGILFGRLILSVEYPVLVGRMLKIPGSSQMKAILRPGVVTLILFLAAAALDSLLPTAGWHSLSGWITFVLSAGVTFCVFLALAFFGGLSRKQQQTALHRVLTVMGTSSENKG